MNQYPALLVLGPPAPLSVQAVAAQEIHYVTEWPAWQPMDHPSGIATDANGNVYVADGGNDMILKFDATGHFIRKFGSSGSEDGQFSDPSAVATDPSGTSSWSIRATPGSRNCHQTARFS